MSDERKKLGKLPFSFDVQKVVYIESEVCYWRKVNQIHRWFVENVQDGNDDCEKYPVTKETIRRLLADVLRVLDDNDRAAEILPTQEGFFFGSVRYDEGYYNDLKATKTMLLSLLHEWDDESEYHYLSSW